MSRQNYAIKNGIYFSLSVNFSVGLAKLAESLRNYLEAAIRGFSRGIFYESLLFLPDGK